MRTKTGGGRGAWKISDLVNVMDRMAPLSSAQPWDNVGLLAGDPAASARRIVLCIDLTPAVATEAVRMRADLVLAYHPPIFKPVRRIVANSGGTDTAVLTCLRAGVSIYAMHTALDAAPGGTNDVLAELCGLTDVHPLETAAMPGEPQVKLVTFVPREALENVAEALFDAGAGRIGEYARCSFRIEGEGTFFGSEQARPRVGEQMRLERVAETRLEVVVPRSKLLHVTSALRASHPYEEPAFDIYPLERPVTAGIGRAGSLPRRTTVAALAGRLTKRTGSRVVQQVGRGTRPVRRAIVVAGSAGDLPFPHLHGEGDVIVTGEMRHHDALTVVRRGAAAILLGHWESERPVLAPLSTRLAAALPGLVVKISRADASPLTPA